MKPTVIARLTAVRTDGKRIIVEIHSDATFQKFYHFFQQDGRRTSTKRETGTLNRNAHVPHLSRLQPGLELIAQDLAKPNYKGVMPYETIKVRIIRKRDYRRLTTCSSSDIGGGVYVPANQFRNMMTPAAIPLGGTRIIGRAIPASKWLKQLEARS